ncbi:MAG: ABC transporter ATP-binding protein [Planctomycetaceae bacterium]|nr:ABC transporter ATP-binding protein [Planctomycetaceae bacterium]
MSTGDYILEGRGLRKSFGKGAARTDVLRGLDLDVRRGEFIAVMGPSGCGKSTLLHVLGLMAVPDEGTVLLDGLPVPTANAARTLRRRQDIGFVFQRFNLLGTLSAADNIAISLKVRGIARDGRAAELFEALDISHVARRKPSQMSIGEQQRVAVARALAHRPKLLLADEPTGNLDSANAEALLKLFQTINRQQNQTIVMITHSAEAAAAADRVVGMKDGRIIETP